MSGDLAARLLVRREGFTLDIGLSIEVGTTAALLGPNGAGKTTAVRAIAGLEPLDEGRVSLGDQVLEDVGSGVRLPPEERNIGVVFQDYLLFGHMTVAENVAFGLVSQGRSEAAVPRWLDRFGLTGKAEMKASALSGGEAQRVALARALITEPGLLVLDEPMAALDASTRVHVRRDLTDHLRGFPGPRVLITHDPTEAFLIGDEIYVLEEGRIVQKGTPDEIRMRPRTRYVADLAGANLLRGTAESGRVDVGGVALAVADTSLVGPVLATVHPHAISLHRTRPEGSQRNVWQTVTQRIERYGNLARVLTGDPLPLTVEVTQSAVEGLGLSEGERVWVAIKATEIGIEPV